MPRFFRGRQQPGIASFLLLVQILQLGMNNIPPVTLGGIAVMAALFFKPDPVMEILRIPSLENVCVNVRDVWIYGEWKRLLLAGLFHLNEWHLYYNMTSFLWKGMTLESVLGSGYFLFLLSVFSVLCNVVLIGLSALAAHVFHQPLYMVECAAGFSGVLFALKVLNTHLRPAGTEWIIGIPIPTRLGCWAELLLIQIIVPNASFMGHLAGILVGLAYAHGPLKYLMDYFWCIKLTLDLSRKRSSVWECQDSRVMEGEVIIREGQVPTEANTSNNTPQEIEAQASGTPMPVDLLGTETKHQTTTEMIINGLTKIHHSQDCTHTTVEPQVTDMTHHTLLPGPSRTPGLVPLPTPPGRKALGLEPHHRPRHSKSSGLVLQPTPGHNKTSGLVLHPTPGHGKTPGLVLHPTVGHNRTSGLVLNPTPGHSKTTGLVLHPTVGHNKTSGLVLNPTSGHSKTSGLVPHATLSTVSTASSSSCNSCSSSSTRAPSTSQTSSCTISTAKASSISCKDPSEDTSRTTVQVTTSKKCL